MYQDSYLKLTKEVVFAENEKLEKSAASHCKTVVNFPNLASVIINYYHKGLKRERESKQTNWEQTFLENSLKTF